MTIHTCAVCEGTGKICARCGMHHRKGRYGRRCLGRKKVACPGQGVVACFPTRTECDVCRVSKLGPSRDAVRWAYLHLGAKWLHLCGECELRYEEIQTMTLEYLMTERSELRAGEVIP